MEVIISTYSTGINNKVTPARISYNQESGVADLETADNVIIDSQGGIVSANGNTLVESGDWHSGISLMDGSFYAAKNRDADTALYKVTPQADGTVTTEGIGSNFTKGAMFSWREVDGEYFFMNGYEKGRIVNHVLADWPTSEWPRETTAQMIETPVGSHLDMLSGRFIIGRDKELIYTEPGLWGLIDNVRNYREFESRILMVCSVDTGLYVSDSEAVYWLAGTNPEQWQLDKVLSYPAIEYSRNNYLVDPSHFGFQTSKPSALFGTVNGPVVGLSDGTAVNLIDKKVQMPTGMSQGAIMIVDETTIIQSGV